LKEILAQDQSSRSRITIRLIGLPAKARRWRARKARESASS
jgi:hypothetical protein